MDNISTDMSKVTLILNHVKTMGFPFYCNIVPQATMNNSCHHNVRINNVELIPYMPSVQSALNSDKTLLKSL